MSNQLFPDLLSYRFTAKSTIMTKWIKKSFLGNIYIKVHHTVQKPQGVFFCGGRLIFILFSHMSTLSIHFLYRHHKRYYVTIVTFLLSKKARFVTIKSNQNEIIWKYLAARSYCLTFYYHMLGSNMGDLKIFTQNGTQSAVEKWSTCGNQGDV